ncbi:MAG: hypothetical protein IPP91_05010 [Betaproteobacteria bacterium]|nr:hypothetical protein [Betaproteobacteria bacterium]
MNRIALEVAAATASLLLMFPWDACAQGSSLFLLRVQGEGTGYGDIRSNPSVLNCAANAGTSCFQYVNANTTVVLTATPHVDSVFAGWSGACSGTGTCSVTMDAGKTVTATFNAKPGTNYLTAGTLPSTGASRGTIVSSPAGIDCGAACKSGFPAGTTVTLTALPSSGSTFTGWSGDCAGTGACQVTMTGPKTAFATFTAPSPSTANYTSLWWNPTESGWGVNLNHQGNTIFATLFTYDATGAPLWLVMSAGNLQSGSTFTGDLYRTTGPAFNAAPFTPLTGANLTTVGTMSLSFIGVDSGTLTYTVNGVTVTKFIQRQVYGSRAANCTPTTASRASLTNYQDLWWNAAESGWGVNVTHQDNTLFAALFTYDAAGHGLWLVMSGGVRQADGSYLGDLYQTTGPPFNANPFRPITYPENFTTVGSMRFRFSDGINGTLTYTYNGVSVTKAITRQVFSSTSPACT